MYLVCVFLSPSLCTCVHAYMRYLREHTCQDTNVKVKRQFVIVSFSLLTWAELRPSDLVAGACLY